MRGIIIGGGIAGLTTAIAMQQIGIKCTVFESSAELNKVGAGIMMASNAMQVFNKLGLAGDVQRAGIEVDSFAITDSNFKTIQETDQIWIRKKYGFGITSIHRGDLQHILVRHLDSDVLHLGKEFQSFSNTDHQVQANFSDGTTAEGDFLLGADGIHSQVREHLFNSIWSHQPKTQLRYSGQTCWRGIVDMNVPKFLEKKGIESWGRMARFGIIPINANSIYWFAVVSAKQGGADISGDVKNDLVKHFNYFHPFVLDLILATSETKIIRNDLLDFKPMEKWSTRNICLIGDAAHATTPNLGQGGCQAVEDALVLQQIFKKQKSLHGVFSSFEQTRMSKTAKITKESHRLGQLAHAKYGHNIRNLILRSIPPFITKKQVDWILRLGSI